MFHKYLFIPLFVIFAGSLHAEVEMLVGVDRTTVYEGEVLHYQIALSDSKPVDDSIVPDLSNFSDFEVRTLPKQIVAPSNSSFTLTINGRVVRDESSAEQSGVLFTYQLTPKKTGESLIPLPKVVADGKTLRPQIVKIGGRTVQSGGTIPVTVRPPDVQDIARLEIKVDRQRLYPYQPLTATLTVRIKALPDDLGNPDPLSVLKDPPRLTIPWVDDPSLPKGIVPRENRNEWLTALAVRGREGFSINDYAGGGIGFDDDWMRSPLSMGGMFRSTLLRFSPKPAQVRLPAADGRETNYWEYRFSRTFIPEQFGSYSFGPVTLRGALAVADSSSKQGASAKAIYAVAPAVSVDVIDVPEKRPAEYIGVFGTFDWSADIQPRKARVGEPMTLTLQLKGHGSTTGVKPPDLSAYPEIVSNFKTYPPSEEVKGESCILTYTVRPSHSGAIVFPPIPIAFFDVEKEQFVTLRSESIPLEIETAETLKNVPLGDMSKRRSAGELERSEKGLFVNMVSPDTVLDRSVDYRRWTATMTSFGLVYLVLASGVAIRRRWNVDPVRKRRSGAASRARQRLAELKRELDRPNPDGRLQGILCGYAADLSGVAEQGMTTKDACLRLLELGATEKTIGELRGIFDALDAARYGGFGLRSTDELIRAAESLLGRLRDETNSKSRQ